MCSVDPMGMTSPFLFCMVNNVESRKYIIDELEGSSYGTGEGKERMETCK